jgi:S-adenosylmethionine synthetase
MPSSTNGSTSTTPARGRMSNDGRMPGSYEFSSESVTAGHPDKMADQISDGIADEAIGQDPGSRTAIETMLTTDLAIVAGEINTKADLDIERIVRDTIRDIGYVGVDDRFDADKVEVMIRIDQQSPDIAQGVDSAAEVRERGSTDEIDGEGAGDQGMMVGYATTETSSLMPAGLMYSRAITDRLTEARESGDLPYLCPDGKAQVTLRYEHGKPVKIVRLLVSTHHRPGIDRDGRLRPDLVDYVLEPVLPRGMYDPDELFHAGLLVNPTGSFEVGGPVADTGLTGRKIIVDTYGGAATHGGGAFSGKDPSKVDRSGAYAARWVAKNVVAAGLADRCELQIAYAIGVAKPMSVKVETFGTERIDRDRIVELVDEHFDLRPLAFRRELDLHRPIYRKTAAHGHFGRQDDPDFTWERTDRAAALHEAAMDSATATLIDQAE